MDNGEYASPSALARHLKVTRARVTQILNLLQLSPEVINIVASFGDPLQLLRITERRLRPFLSLSVEQQKAQVKAIISK